MDHALQAILGVHQLNPPVCFDFGKADMDDDKQYIYTSCSLLSSTAIEPVKRRIPSDLRN